MVYISIRFRRDTTAATATAEILGDQNYVPFRRKGWSWLIRVFGQK